MKKFIASFQIVFSIVLVAFISACAVTVKPDSDYLSQLAARQDAPKMFDTKENMDGSTHFYFEGEAYNGKPTRVFAIYNEPSTGSAPYPAVVLVHGGGGTAFSAWVKKWNDAGFAAISIAVEGQTDVRLDKRVKGGAFWEGHEWAGPARVGVYHDNAKPLQDQWMYHAVSATIRANNLLRSFSTIDTDHIGLAGISWGGVISSTVVGFDQRFDFAIPIYGCGHLSVMGNHYQTALQNNATYLTYWEPGLRIANYQGPTLWLTGLNDQHFSLDAQAQTYEPLSGPTAVSIQEDLMHGHGAGWNVNEPYRFAQAVVANKPLPLIFDTVTQTRQQLQASITTAKPVKTAKAILFYSTNTGHTGKRQWEQMPIAITQAGDQLSLMAEWPADATAGFFNVEINHLVFSSEFLTRAE